TRLGPLRVPDGVDPPAPVDANGAATMRAGRDAPAIGGDETRRAEGASAVSRGAQHHVADVARKDLAPDDGHGLCGPGRRVDPAAYARVLAHARDAIHAGAAVDHAGQIGAGIGAARAAVEPRDEHRAVGGDGEAVEGVRDRTVLVHAQMADEALAAV